MQLMNNKIKRKYVNRKFKYEINFWIFGIVCCKEATEGAAVSTQRPNRKLNSSTDRKLPFIRSIRPILLFIVLFAS
jgi:hypothetical protein